ncbi:MAG TPA: DUF3185 family protein [Opitutaceae bacterium]|nr:DUF3185 family protein [Opitutaceae bacterium]
MRTFIAIILIAAGIGLIWHGFQVRNSLKGKAQEAGSELHQSLNGNSSVTDATWFFVGGGVIVIAGVATAVKR